MKRAALSFPYLLLAVVVAIVVVSNIPSGQSDRGPAATRITMCAPCGMDVDPETALSAEVRGRLQYFCGDYCRQQALDSATTVSHAGDDRLVDVVCQMEVNRAWGFESQHDGNTYYFCARRCREKFDADPQRYLAATCIVCDAPTADKPTFAATYLGTTYNLCSLEHRDAFKADPAAYFMHTMWGIPTWLYYTSIAFVMIVSFGVFDLLSRKTAYQHAAGTNKKTVRHIGRDAVRGEGERLAGPAPVTGEVLSASLSLPVISLQPAGSIATTLRAGTSADRFDLLGIKWINAAVRSRIFRFACQAVITVLFLLIIAAGLFGNQNPAMNIAPILTWTVWWGALIILILFAGKAWCYVCPWDAVAGWTEKLSFWKKSDEGLGLNLKWPRIVRNILIATILFVGLTWIELGFGVTMKPKVTAYLAIAMLLMAVVAAMLFDRKSFCRYGCLVGRVSGLYALFASIEVRARNAGKCKACHTKECVAGSESAYGCPTFLYPGKLETNTYCIQCMECVQACPHDNLAMNLRPWGSDLAIEGRPRADEAYLALLMLAITGFHGLTMTPVWAQFIDALRGATGFGRFLGFSTGMALLMLGPIGVYAVLVAVSKKLGDRSNRSSAEAPRFTYRDYFIRYAYAVLPIALFYHIAHNMEHLLMEGPKVAAMISDPFGWGWNLFGTAAWTIPPLISLDKLWIVQVLLVLVGHVYSLWVAQQTSLRLFGSSKAAFRSQLPMLAGMICFSVFSLWLLKQPMEMRTSAM